ncbi:MAG: hypothetical protein OXR68_00105 [Alphaproteobacteria bacterium]|nr:hypothetical protein [Alphaproteobacteria bacterium]MDD9919013.1 hypothetical protein [Alphaproteobacteria bacterium]
MTRTYLPVTKSYKKIKPAEEIVHSFSKSAITQQHNLSIKGNFTVTSTAPTGVPIQQLMRMIEKLEVEDSRGVNYWDISGVSLGVLLASRFGVKIQNVDVAASGTNADFELNIPITYGRPTSPNSYDTGMNTYTKDATLNITLADWEKDGKLWAANNDFSIDGNTVQVDITAEQFDVSNASTVRQRPEDVLMTTLIERPVAVKQDNAEEEFELDKGRVFTDLHLIGIEKTTASGLEVGSYGVFDMENVLKIHEKDLTGRQTHKVLARHARRFMTEFARQNGSANQTGYLNLSLVHENRGAQARVPTTGVPINLYMPVKAPASGKEHKVLVVQDGMFRQD